MTQIGSDTYRYGNSGELSYAKDGLSAANDRWFGYDGLQNLNLVLVGSMMAPSAELNLRYSPGGERYRREERIASATTTTRSVGSVEFITRPDGVVETKRHIAGLLIETRFSNGAATTKRYLYPDGLGSIDAITNEAGTVQERLGFDGHGSRRNGDDWRSAITSYTPQTTTRGYTGHEHLDPFKLIHMNGRVYDPQMGRFIQADPVLDAGIQGLNRYSYALNNPLTFTDPSGYSSWNKWLRTVAAIVITYYTGGAASNLYAASNIPGAFAMAAAGGFAAGSIQSGTMKGVLYGAFGSAAFFGVGTAFTQANASWAYTGDRLNSIGRVAKTVSHGMVGGVMSDLQGGKFGHGFVSAGATQAISPQIDNINSASGRIMAAAALGGSVSAITGGKFANGAVTSAFSYAFGNIVKRTASLSGVPQVADVTAGAPEDLISLLNDPEKRIEAIRKIMNDNGMTNYESIEYIHDQLTGPSGEMASMNEYLEMQVYAGAFAGSYGVLGSILYHEYYHGEQFIRQRTSGLVNTNMMEVEAYDKMMTDENPFRSLLTPSEISGYQTLRNRYYRRLSSNCQYMASAGQYNCSN